MPTYNSNPTSTIGTYLMKGTGSGTLSYTKLCDIKDYPDLIGAPEALETTTLSDTARTYIQGLKNNEQLTFTANYTENNFNTLNALSGVQHLAVDFGTDGADGRFTFDGYVSVSIVGHGINEVREMSIVITPTTVITFVPKSE